MGTDRSQIFYTGLSYFTLGEPEITTPLLLKLSATICRLDTDRDQIVFTLGNARLFLHWTMPDFCTCIEIDFTFTRLKKEMITFTRLKEDNIRLA